MSDNPTTYDDLSAADMGRVNEACERFETALRAGLPLPMASVVETVPDELRPVLLAELVRLEIEANGRSVGDKVRATVGRYRLGEELGRGGFGIVYKASDPDTGSAYAVKVPRDAAKAHPEFPDRFRREARAVTRLDHPNVVKVYDVGTGEPDWFLAAEYVAGVSLKAWLDEYDSRKEFAPIPVAARILAGVADGVHHAHERGVIHRDLKPANILLAGDDQVPKVTDFGLACLLDGDEAVSLSGLLIGTTAYMAPEQATGRGRRISARTDVYSLGAVLYELLVRRPPFETRVTTELLVQLLTADPVPPRLLRPEIPADLEAVCLRCLEKDPARRFGTAGEVAEELRRHLAGRPTHTRPPGAVRRARAWAWKHKVAATATAAGVVFAAVGGTGLAVHTRRLERVNRALDGTNQDLSGALATLDRSNRALRRVAYAAAVRKADALLSGGEPGEATRLLDGWATGSAAEDLRGWEWYYLKHKVDLGCVARWSPGVMHGVAYSPDGRALAGAGEDGRVHVWDPETGRDLVPPLAVRAAVKPLAWTPDGRRLAVGDSSGLITIWSPTDGTRRELNGHRRDDIVSSLSVSPDGTTLASAGRDGTVRLWDLAGGSNTSHVCARRESAARAVGFTPDGTALVVGWETDGTEIVEAVPAGKTIGTLTEPGAGGLVAVRGSSDSRFLTVGRSGVLVWKWDAAASQATLLRRVPGPDVRVNDAAWSADGKTLAVATDAGVKIWAADGPHPRGQLCGHEGRVWSVAFRPATGLVATAGGDGAVKVWDVENAPPTRMPLAVRGESRLAVASVPAARGVTVDPAGRPRLELWEVNETGLRRVAAGAADSVRAFCRGTGTLLTQNDRGWVTRWDVSDADGPAAAAGPSRLVPTVLFRAAAADPPDAEVHGGCVAADPHGRWIAASWPKDVHVWDVTERRTVGVLSMHRRTVHAMAASPDGTLLATAGNDRICLWNMTRRDLEAPPTDIRSVVYGLAFHPNGSVLASAGDDWAIKLWDLKGRLLQQWRGHTGLVRSLSFSPDGRTAASASSDGTVRLWQADTGDDLLTLPGWGGPQYFVAFSPCGRHLVGEERGPGPNQYVIRHYDSGHAPGRAMNP